MDDKQNGSNEVAPIFDVAKGNQKELWLATPGKKVIIREITGEDEDILTLMKDQKDGSSIAKFVANVVISPKLTFEEVNKWRARDKYLVLFETVRLTYGDTVHFKWKFKDGITQEYEEDLLKYVWDFNPENKIPYPIEGSKGYFDQRIVPYKDDKLKHIFELPSGKKVGFYYVTGELESNALLVDENSRSANDDLRDRNFFEIQNGQEVPIENFRIYGGRDMAKIRSEIYNNDPAWMAFVDINHPRTDKLNSISLFTLGDFLFPRLQ